MADAEARSSSSALPSEWNPTVQSLVRSLDEARYFQGSLIIVHGPPGVGKTRLINGALAEGQVSARRIRRTFLEPRDTEAPYKAVLSLARWAAKLEEIAPAMDSGSLVLMPFVRRLAADGGANPPEAPVAGQSGSPPTGYERLIGDLEFYKRGVEAWGDRSRFLHEVGWLILDAAARRHVVWVVESAQYLDPSSLSLVRHLASCLDENPLVMWLNVDTPSGGRLPPSLESLLEGPRRRDVEVPRLSRAGVAEVLGWKWPAQALSDRVIDRVWKESDGLLLTAEQLASDPEVLRGLTAHPAPDAADVVRVGLQKLEEVAPSARELAERLSILGTESSIGLATHLSDRSEAEVRADLASLMEAGVLLEQEPGHFLFRLAALPAEIEGHLSANRARELHRAAAEALEASPSGKEERIFELAEHWRKAESWEAAARASLAAARFSLDTFAPEGGLLYAQRASEAARKLEDGASPLVAEALVEAGRAYYDLGRLHESVATLREAVERIGGAPEAWPARARALFYLARALSSLANPQEALEVVREASAALAHVDDARGRLMLHQVIGVALMMSNQNREAVEHFRSMLKIAQELGDAREVSYAQKNLSAVLLALDPHDPEGWQLVDSALEHHVRTGNFAGLAAGFLNRSLTKLELRDTEGALKDLARSREAAELARAPLLIASATLEEARVRLDRLEGERAEGLLRALAPWMSAMEEPWARTSFALLMGRVSEAQRRPDEADRLYEEAMLLAEASGDLSSLWECRLRRALLAKNAGAQDQLRRLERTLPSVEEISQAAPRLVDLRKKLGPTGS